MELLFMDPVFKEAIWGGTKLRDVFDYEIPSDTTGECWAISGHANGMSRVAGGRFDGKTLGELWKEEPEIFGNYPGSQVPLLIKIIDAKNDLSIQVHPDDAYAGEHENGSLGKTECWYVLDCEPGTEIVIGHNAKDKAEVEKMIRNHEWSDFIRKVPVHKGDFFQINPGSGAGCSEGCSIFCDRCEKRRFFPDQSGMSACNQRRYSDSGDTAEQRYHLSCIRL